MLIGYKDKDRQKVVRTSHNQRSHQKSSINLDLPVKNCTNTQEDFDRSVSAEKRTSNIHEKPGNLLGKSQSSMSNLHPSQSSLEMSQNKRERILKSREHVNSSQQRLRTGADFKPYFECSMQSSRGRNNLSQNLSQIFGEDR